MTNSALSNNEIKSLIKIAALLSLKDWDRLKIELQQYINNNYNLQYIDETFLTSYLFLGFPAMITAFEILSNCEPKRKNFKISKKNNYVLWKNKGLKLFNKIYNNKSKKLLLKLEKMHPELSNWMLTEGYGKVLSRKFLPIKIRELIIITFLIITSYPKQLLSHIKGALNVGATHNDISFLFSILQEINVNKKYIEDAFILWNSIK